MFNFKNIDTILLDMDGTLLDLHFDDLFWKEVIPKRYAERYQLTLNQARQVMAQHYQKVQGTLHWYCLDYWQETLNLPILSLKQPLVHLIKMRADTIPLLTSLRTANKRLILVTNAHPDCLALKLKHTSLAEYLDDIISTHQFGYVKEDPQLWEKLMIYCQYDPKRCLFIDDNEHLLTMAQHCGIGHLLAVSNPDSHKKPNLIQNFPFISDFTELIPAIKG